MMTLISLYTGLPSYNVLLSFCKFLGLAVDSLTYWGTRRKTQSKRCKKLNSFNQLFLTLVKLKLDLNVRHILATVVGHY